MRDHGNLSQAGHPGELALLDRARGLFNGAYSMGPTRLGLLNWAYSTGPIQLGLFDWTVRWVPLDWVPLDWVPLDWVPLDWVPLDWVPLDWVPLDWVPLWAPAIGSLISLRLGLATGLVRRDVRCG